MPTIPGLPPRSILYTGGSIIDRPWKGYEKLKPPPTVLIPPYGTGMGTLKAWTTPGNKYLAMFDQQLRTYPHPAGVAIMFCSHDKDAATAGQFDPAVLEAQARQHVADIRGRVGAGVRLFGIPMFRYVDKSCPQVVKAQPATELLVNKLVAEGLIERGPVLTALKATQLANGRCDQNVAGRTVHGKDLLAFFG